MKLPAKNALEQKFSDTAYYLYIGILIPLVVALIAYAVYGSIYNVGLPGLLNEIQASYRGDGRFFRKASGFIVLILGMPLLIILAASIAFLFDCVSKQGIFARHD